MNKQLLDLIDSLSDGEKAKLAAQILKECDPTRDNILMFFRTLDDTMHDELISRAAHEEERS